MAVVHYDRRPQQRAAERIPQKEFLRSAVGPPLVLTDTRIWGKYLGQRKGPLEKITVNSD